MASTISTTSHIWETVRTCIAGSAFGAALTLARVYLPGVIIDQMRLKDFHMLEVFLSATAFSSLVFLSLEKLGLSKRVTRANSRLSIFKTNLSRYDGNILGGALIGTGMALAGACPGTVIIQLAQGIPIARITMLGAILGGTIWTLTGDKVVDSSTSASVSTSNSSPSAVPESASITDSKSSSTSKKAVKKVETTPLLAMQTQVQSRLTIPQALNTNPSITYIVFLLLLAGTTAASVAFLPGKSQALIPTVLAGTLVAVSQALSLIVASTPLGTSAAYEQIGRYLARTMNIVFGLPKRDVPAFPPKSVIFAVGMVLGSVLVGRYEDILDHVLNQLPGFDLLPVVTSVPAVRVVHISGLQALIGGFVLSYGSRMAGGCTSGHGITGLSSLSFASLISVMSMFGAGIAVRHALDLLIL